LSKINKIKIEDMVLEEKEMENDTQENKRDRLKAKIRKIGETIADYVPEMAGVLATSVSGNAFVGAAVTTGARRLLDRFLKSNSETGKQNFANNIQNKLSKFNEKTIQAVYCGNIANTSQAVPNLAFCMNRGNSL